MASRLANRGFAAEPKGASLLGSDRVPSVGSTRQLLDIARAIEVQAFERYRELARQVARQGHADTARTFLRMAAEAEAHAAATDRLAAELGAGAADAGGAGEAAEALPPDFAASWDEAGASALLTPYRALAIAVTNAQRAFVFYSYLAAHAPHPAVAREAERLALAKLQHAAALRRWRRAAYREGRVGAAPARAVEAGDLADWVAQAKHDIAVCHRTVAQALQTAGDAESASLLRSGGVRFEDLPATETCPDPACAGSDPVLLLTAAQKPLERFVERLEAALAAGPEEAEYMQIQQQLETAVGRLAAVRRRIGRLMQAEQAHAPAP